MRRPDRRARTGGAVGRHRLHATNHFEIPRVFAAPERDPLRAALAHPGTG